MFKEFLQEDVCFHGLFYQIANRKDIQPASRYLSIHYNRLRTIWMNTCGYDNPQRLLNDHQAIVDAIQERDPEKCYQGLVVRIIPAGLVVDLPELGMHGFVPKPRYSPSSGFRRRQLDIADTAGYNCGDPVLLRLTGIDPVRNSAEFCAVRNRRDQRNPKLNT